MHFKIHRGTKEIGGSCVEVWTDKTRIVIDFGIPLFNPDRTPFNGKVIENKSTSELIKSGLLADIPSLYVDNSNTALLISHAHRDHYGFIDKINHSCPVWMGYATHLLIEISNTFDNNPAIKNVRYFEHDKEFKIGDITIRPYLMDHDTYDAYAFLIKADGKSLIYSGDFRLHGRKTDIFDYFKYRIEKNVDYLFLEGSAIDNDVRFRTESELEDDFAETFSQTKGINLVFVSGQNIDRLVTVYEACKKAGKTFLIDFYIANVLKILNEKVDKNILFPCGKSYPEVKVYYPLWLTKRMIKFGKRAETMEPFTSYKLGKDKIDEQADKLVMIVYTTVQNDLALHLHKYSDGCFIYSMWEGYKNQPGKTKNFLDFITAKGMPVKDIHTSGHANLDGLREIVKAVKPKHLVPIHTFEGDKYALFFPGVDVLRVADKETVEM